MQALSLVGPPTNPTPDMQRKDLAVHLLKVQEIAKDVVAPSAADIDRNALWPEPGIRAMQPEG